jgi:ERCC4-related helicase
MNDGAIPTLPTLSWKTSYRHEDGDLVGLFYIPALECALRYDRMTGYFSADALALAGRGIERLIANGGTMRLIVGCTLDEAEVQAIEQGYDLRAIVEQNLIQVELMPPDMSAKNGLAALAWLIAQGRMDVKVAVPVNPAGQPVPAFALYHEKVGIITDNEGNCVSFSGSINETRGGWINNRESFHVHCGWEGGREAKHVADEVEAFQRLWTDQAKSIKIIDFPEAARKRLLEFLPRDDRFAKQEPVGTPFKLRAGATQTPGRLNLPGNSAGTEGRPSTSQPEEPTEGEPAPLRPMPEEVRQVVWTYIHNAARMWNGIRVGEATSAVKPWPHQLRTFARMYQGWPCRLLIADEVGLGKTISAGLLIRQGWLAGLFQRVLILVPASVLTQWQNELYEKFNLNLPIYDGHKLIWRKTHGEVRPSERKVGAAEWHKERLVLCSSHLMRRRDRASELIEAEDWDLILLDEAHHARRKAPGSTQEGGPNRLLRLMHDLKDKSKSLILLTATPMQVHPVEIWDLLNLLGLPARWAASKDDFIRYFRLASDNPSQAELEFLASMFQDVESAFGPVDEQLVEKIVPEATPLTRQRVLKALRDRQSGIPLRRLDTPARRAALEILRRFSPIRYRMSRHTRELLRLYHQKGLLETPIATRDVRDIAVEMTPTERELYDSVEEYIGTTYNNAAQEQRSAVGFVMTIYRRRLASSFHALRQTLNKRLSGQGLTLTEEDVSQDEQVEEVMDAEEAAEVVHRGLVVEERTSIQGLLKKIAQLGTDTKVRKLMEEIERAFADGYHSTIVFTQYTDTMDYLKEHIAQAFPEVPIGCYSGRGGQIRDQGGFWNECKKEHIKRKLKDGSIRLLICTDAAAEGLNFQTCGVVINLDLPWNPMKVEQRIGRIDRIGQVYSTIRVVNFAYEDTVEADVYFALGKRINLFQGIVGKLQPILSRLPQEFERVSLERPEHKEAARQRLISDVEGMVAEAEEGGFDVDEVAGESLDLPELPSSALTLPDIDLALNWEDVRPPGCEWKALDPGSYSLRLPGITKKIRVTTSADLFDDQFESHDLLSPGGVVFEELGKTLSPRLPAESPICKGIWLVPVRPGSRELAMVLRTPEGEITYRSLGEVIAGLESLDPRGL